MILFASLKERLLILLKIGLTIIALFNKQENVFANDERPKTFQQDLKIWGKADYIFNITDKVNASSMEDWPARQQAELTLNVISPYGLSLKSDFIFSFDTKNDNVPNAGLQQLFIRFSPTNWLTLITGKQRLNWGTGKFFAAFDKTEPRTNFLDFSSNLAGVTGVKMVLAPWDWLGLQALILPNSHLSWTTGALRLEAEFIDLNWDISLGGCLYRYSPSGNSFMREDAANQLPRIAIISDSAFSFGDAVWYYEAELRFGRENGYWFPGMDQAQDFLPSQHQAIFRGLMGVLWKQNVGLSRPLDFVLEYFFNAEGFSFEESQTFSDRYIVWKKNSGQAPVIPASLTQGIGAFRQHYLGLGLLNLALMRYLLGSITLIYGIDSGLVVTKPALSYSFSSHIVLSFMWLSLLTAYPQTPNELTLFPSRNMISVKLSTSY